MIHKTILLVDDDLDDQVIFLDALTEIAKQVTCKIANNGVEAFKILQRMTPPPSIIFLDLNMPFMNGFECLGLIKKDEAYKRIPMVILTTSNDPVDEARAKGLGAQLFFTKTPDFNLLKSTIMDVLTTDFSFTNMQSTKSSSQP